MNIYINTILNKKNYKIDRKSGGSNPRSPTEKAKQKYRGVFDIQKSENKTSSGEIGFDVRPQVPKWDRNSCPDE